MSNSSVSVSQNFSQIMFANQSQTFAGIKTFDEVLINNAMCILYYSGIGVCVFNV